MVGVTTLKFPEVKRIHLNAFDDERGFFTELHRQTAKCFYVQDNHSFSVKGTIRGMHFQAMPGQAKLITVIVGTIYDVFVDIRPDSPTFGKWGAYELDANAHEQLFIPVGFAHGFAALKDSHVIYKVSSFFDPKEERTIRYDDPEIGIEWPIDHPILSERDRNAPFLNEVFG